MNKRLAARPTVTLTTIALACAAGTMARAASITWGSPQAISGDADVSLSGFLVGAVNLDGPATTVNGVNFQALDIDAGPATVGNFTINGFFFNQFNPGLSTGSGAAPFSSLSVGYQSLLATAAAPGGNTRLDITGLAVGVTYEFQVWVNDSQNHIPPGFTFTVRVEDLLGNNVVLDPSLTLVDGGLGQFVLGQFTADNTTQALNFGIDEVGTINGFQLRALDSSVPEAETTAAGIALSAMAGATWLQRRRVASRPAA